jgi:hypothetical protein
MADRTEFLKALEELRKSGQADLSALNSLPKTEELKLPTKPNFDLPTWGVSFGGQAEAPKQSGNGQAWWRDALDAMSGLGSAGTDFVAHQMDNVKDIFSGKHSIQNILKGDFSFKDINNLLGDMDPIKGTLNRLLDGGVKGQIDAWKQPGLGAEDIPGVGFLMGMNDKAQHGSDILTKLGADPNSKATKWGGIGLDIALDPTTYLTFGAGSVAKAGVRAGASTAAKTAAQYGAKVGRTTDETLANIQKAIFAKVGDPVKAEELYNGIQKTVSNSEKAARFKSQNALFSFDVPFTNITTPLIQKGAKNPFFITENTVHGAQAAQAGRMLNALAGDDPAKAADLLKRTYGIDDVAKMNAQQFDHLASEFEKVGGQSMFPPGKDPFASDTPTPPSAFSEVIPPKAAPAAGNAIPPQALESGLKGLPGPEVISTGGKASSRIPKAAQVIDGEFSAVDNVLPELSKFVQDAGGQSKVGRALRNTGIGKALTTRNGHIASEIADAEQATHGGKAYADMQVKSIDKTMKGLSDTQRREVVDVVEGTRQASNDQIRAAADEIRKVLDGVKGDEQASGILKQTLDNYFPHVLSDNPELLAKFEKLKQTDPVLGQFSQGSQFSKERQSFRTMKELDDYLSGVKKAAENATGNEANDLWDKYNTVSQLFERDPSAALTKRLHKSARATAMAKMYTRFKKDGLLFKAADAPQDVRDLSDFKRLSESEAKKLGLDTGDYVHKEVMEGLSKVRGLFTDENMNDILSSLDRVNGIWKTLVTTSKPSHHLYNLMGNVAVNMMAGVNPKYYTQAGKFLKRFKSGKVSEEDVKLMKDMLQRGVLFGGDTSEYVKALGSKWKVEKFAYDNPYTKLMTRIGHSFDNFSRVAHYMDKLEKTRDPKMAAQSVRKYLFNYREMTKTDRGIRLIAPFWNWTKRNIPLQLEKLMQTPRYAQTYNRIQAEMMEEHPDTPEYRKKSAMNIGLGGFDLRLPLSNLDDLSDPSQMLLNQLGPYIKVPVETKMNQSMFTGNPIDYQLKYEGKRDPQAWTDYAAQQTGILGDLAKILGIAGNDSPLEDIRNLLVGKPIPSSRKE